MQSNNIQESAPLLGLFGAIHKLNQAPSLCTEFHHKKKHISSSNGAWYPKSSMKMNKWEPSTALCLDFDVFSFFSL